MAQQKRNQKCKCCKDGGIYQNLWPIPSNFNFGNFFNFIILHSFSWGINRSLENAVCEEWVIFFCLGEIKTWERVFLGGLSKNDQTYSQMYLPVILTPWIWNFSATMVEHTGLGKNSRMILER